MKLSDFVWRYLKEHGVEHVFTLPGGGCMHLVDSLGRSGIPYTVCLHEQAAAIAADGYAQYTGKLGVVLVTTGPGGTNALTGVAGSWIDSTPLLVISGQVKRADMLGGSGVRQMGPQEVDVATMALPVTKAVFEISQDPRGIGWALETAVAQATSGRKGPVWLDIPLDVQAAEVDDEGMLRYRIRKEVAEGNGYPVGVMPVEKGVHSEQLADATVREWNRLRESKRPVILAGHGIRAAGAVQEFCELVERLRVPVLLTWRALDLLPEDHPLLVGRPGVIPQKAANLALQESDYLLCIGARLDRLQVGFDHAGFAPKAHRVVVDINWPEIAKLPHGYWHIYADAGDFIRAAPPVCCQDNWHDWRNQCDVWKREHPVIRPEYREQDPINTYAFIDALSEAAGPDDVIVPASSGTAAEITAQAWRLKDGQRYIFSPGLGSMGWGLPQAIGVALASGRQVISILGDGDLQHNIQELETIRRLNLPIKIFVLNNDGYASIRSSQQAHFGRLAGADRSSGVTVPPLCGIASAYRIPYTWINRARCGLSFTGKQVDEVLHGKEALLHMLGWDNTALRSEGPFITEIMVDPHQKTTPRVHARVLEDGSVVSGRMEDV